MVGGCEITIANWCDDCSYSHVGPCPDDEEGNRHCSKGKTWMTNGIGAS